MNVFHSFFSLLCHQMPSRSPQCLGQVFPLCSRCAGLYFGVLSTYVYIFSSKQLINFFIDKKAGLILTLLILPLFVDGVANFFALWSTPPLVRSITGLLTGITLPLFLMFIQNAESEKHLLNGLNFLHVFVPLIISSAFIFLLTITTSLFIFHLLTVIVAIGFVLFFSNMIITLLCLRDANFSALIK
ncbi:DUF2085 domain-containing protein [Segetibacter aerophilus]|uniref:DUF2085 domain-containing protein n=1 Tax=Segetibacter aerophilus TaxID=670293 RepID=UPI0011BF8F1B